MTISDVKDLVLIVTGISSTVAAYFAIYNARFVARQNIKIAKTEKLIIILNEFRRNYFKQYQAYCCLKLYHEIAENSDPSINTNNSERWKQYNEHIVQHFPKQRIEDIMNGILEFQMISEVFINGKLQSELLKLSKDLYNFTTVALCNQWYTRKPDYQTPEDFHVRANELQMMLIDSLNFSKKSFFRRLKIKGTQLKCWLSVKLFAH